MKGAKKNGFRVGAYHFFRTTKSAKEQFENYKSHVNKESIDLLPMIDVEECKNWTKAKLQNELQEFIDLVKKHYEKAPIIYGTQRSYNSYCAPTFNNYHLMIGWYKSKNPPVIIGKGTYSIWQYSEEGKITGIPKPVDLDVFNSKYEIKHFLLTSASD